MPITLRALLVVAISIAVTLAVRAVLRRFLRPERVEAAQETAGPVMEATAALYGVLAAFILAGVWQRFDDTRGSLILEANAYSNLRQIARIFPPPINTEVGSAIEEYRASALLELGLQARGQSGDDAGEIIGRLWLILARFEPATAGQSELQTRALDAVEELGDARRARLLAVGRTPPTILWLILAGGAAAVLALAMISSVGGRISAVYLALLTAVVSLTLYSIFTLAYPVRSGLLAETSRHSEYLLTESREPDVGPDMGRQPPIVPDRR